MSNAILTLLQSSGILCHLDIHFGSFMERLAGGNMPGVLLAAALVSSNTRAGHVCLDLSTIAGRLLLEHDEGTICPNLNYWVKELRKSSVVGEPGEYKPLILDAHARLYLYRYWDYQERLASSIKRRMSADEDNIDLIRLKERLARLFPSGQLEDIDGQKVAAFAALTRRFCVISGGPGTGKTSTVAKILALLLEQASPKHLRIALAAPTGKAAARLQETIRWVKKSLPCSATIKEKIPDYASTLHRLLGWIPHSAYFRHNAQNPLSVDVMVVDEASMVDLALMSKLIDALPLQTRLILLGDKDQLASVEAGAVLGDICDTGHAHTFSEPFYERLQKATGYKIPRVSHSEPASRINDTIVPLHKSYRFEADSGIGTISLAVNEGDGARALTLLRRREYKDVTWRDVPQPNDPSGPIKERILHGYGDYLRGSDPRDILQRFDRFRLLCALREGPYGVLTFNALAEYILREQKIISPDTRWYWGCPVLITSNDYHLRLFNGDVGIVLPDSEADDELRVFFPGVDGSLRKFHPLRLPEHETVYAMTVHKSQGSEFDEVLFILPARESPVLTRELVYTGMTRAKKRVEIWGPEDVFRTAVSRRIERSSGLRDALWRA